MKLGLTGWIFVALILGVLSGWYLHTAFPAPSAKTPAEKLTEINKVINDWHSQGADTVSKKIELVINQTSLDDDAKLAEIQKIAGGNVASQDLLKQLNQTLKSEEPQNSALKKILEYLSILTDVFLRLIKMIIAPLVLATLVAGVAKLGDIKAVGRIGGKTMLWFFCASFVSLLLGALLVNLYQPGTHLNVPLPNGMADSGIDQGALTLKGFITHIFPSSVFEALASNEILQIVVFALFFGTALAALGEVGKPVIEAFDVIGHTMLKITSAIMYVAPFAVFAAMTAVIAKKGIGVLSTYALFIGEFYSGLLLLWLLLLFIAFLLIGPKVKQLVSRIKTPLLLAFSTASSESAYPKLLEELERFGCKNRIVSFVLPLGYSFNLDGSMMYMTFASLFIAQSYGIELSWGDQMVMLLTLMITSKGVAGVPRASLVVIAGTLSTFNIPEAGLLLLLGVDHILDMGRSATNVVGNAVASVAINKWEEKNIIED
ncbi:MAG: dicarboxylate/amino acid:cation symporter [Bacteroidota bacterium]